jgi:hypothetical protein
MLFPLQASLTDFSWSGGSSLNAVIFLIVIVALIGILIIINHLRKKHPTLSGGLSSSSGAGGSTSRNFSAFTLFRLARNVGLNRDQTKMLDFVLKNDAVTDLDRAINNHDQLDQHFMRAYRSIDQSSDSDEEIQQRLGTLFSTRITLENYLGGGITSSRQLQGTTAVITFNGDKYQVKVVSVGNASLVVECPDDDIPQGSRVDIVVFTHNNKGFSFATRVVGHSEQHNTLSLAHSNQLKVLSQRRFRRRQALIATSFFFVYVEGSGKRQRLVVEKKRYTGNITDISVGGCSITTMAMVKGGARLKIEFNHRGNTVAVLGQVLRTNRTGMNTVMHIKFLRASLRSMNTINAYVYDYD